jgi:hypothetical protein
MAYGEIDPARLEGNALTSWYLRSPTDIEQERQAAATQRYADFFGEQPGAVAHRYGRAFDQSGHDDDRVGQDSVMHFALAPNSAPATSETSRSSGSMQVASSPTKDQCIQQCTPLLERPPRGDRNQWDFHKCVTACMDASRRSSSNSAPSVPSQPLPPPRPTPWWMWIPRLIPDVPPVLA